MEAWVINPFLTEEHIFILAKENLLNDFARCSRTLIVKGIVEYLNEGTNEEIKSLLREAYKSKISFLDIQKDESVLEAVSTVAGYTFSSVNDGLTIDELKTMEKTIKSVYNEECNIPYINPISGDIINNIISTLIARGRVTGNTSYKRLAFLLSKNRELFKDKPNKNATGTVFKPIMRKSTDLDIILRGIQFLIEQKQLGHEHNYWRVF